MDLGAFLKTVGASTQHKRFYHFTDKKNLDLIRKHGLLSTSELKRRNLFTGVTPGGDANSQASDYATGTDQYVCLCFTNNHPMCHVAQNDGTVKGSGSHDKTGKHCLPLDPNGKLDIVNDAGAWMRGDDGQPTRAFAHICWDGCMFPNAVMTDPKTWTDVLRVMIAVRDAHGWN